MSSACCLVCNPCTRSGQLPTRQSPCCLLVTLDKDLAKVPNANRVFSTPVAWPVVTMETVGQTNPARRDGMVWALSAHYIMLIRPQQALPLVRIY